MYELAILGGGPAGVSAAVYAARKRIKTVLIAEHFGGQSTDSLDIQNWIGTPHISGLDLAKQLESHVREYAGDTLEIVSGNRATAITKSAGGFSITAGNTYEAQTILIATGGSRRKLEVPGADTYEHKGVTYCASCDGPMFSGQAVAVVGGGNAGFETALQLLAYCPSVTLIHRHSDFLKADKATVDAAMAHPNFTALTESEPLKVEGEQFVKSLTVKNRATGEETVLPVAAIFVEIGMLPNTDYAASVVTLNSDNRIPVDPRNQRTATDGIWAAGDCTDGLYHQNNIASGDAVKALEDIYLFIAALRQRR